MKKSILFLCLLFAALSCNKDKITNTISPTTVDAIKISEAKQWFESTHVVDNKKQLNATSSVAQSKSLNWNQAVFENRPNEERVYVALIYPNKKFYGREERFRLLITTDKTGKKSESIIHYIADNTYYKKNNHISTLDFTGLILVSDWQDNFLYGLRYEHAKIIGSASPAPTNSSGLTNSPKPNGATHTTLNITGGSCTAITIAYYSCSGYTCDNPVLVGMDTYYDCTGGGGDGGNSGSSGDGGPLGGGGPSGGGGTSAGCGDALVCPDGTPNGTVVTTPTTPASITTIITANLQPCAQNILTSLQNLKGNDIGGLFNYFKNATTTTWNIQNGYIPNDANGIQVNALTSQADGMPTDFLTTTINTTFLNNATDIAVSRTLIHESLHAYLIRWGYSQGMTVNTTMNQLLDGYLGLLSPNDIAGQHDAMANIINQMALALQAEFPTLNLTYAQNLFWAGLTGTNSYNSLSDAQKASIISANTAEVYNQSSAIGKKACN